MAHTKRSQARHKGKWKISRPTQALKDLVQKHHAGLLKSLDDPTEMLRLKLGGRPRTKLEDELERRVTGACSTPTNSGRQVRGVTLRRTAEFFSQDPEVVRQLVRGWLNKKSPRLPNPVGRSAIDGRAAIYEPSALCDFLDKICVSMPGGKAGLLKALRRVERDGFRKPPKS